MSANPSGATISGAASRLSQLLQSEQSPPTDSEHEEAQEAPEQAEDTTEAKETEETTESPETPESDTDSEPEKYTVKVAGEEIEVTLDDLRKGYMMESDYRKKTTAVSQEREKLESKQADLDARLEEAKSLLDLDISNLESDEMKALKEDDPETYLKEFEKVQGKIEKFNKLKTKQQEALQANRDKLVTKEREALMIAFPEWNDQSVMAKEAPDILSTLESVGFTKDELSNVTDHRMFVLAKAKQMLDQVQAKTLKDKEKKPSVKTNKPGVSRSSEDRQNAHTKDLRAKLKKTGNMRDAAKLLTM